MMKQIRSAYDGEFVSSRQKNIHDKNTPNKTSSPQRKLGSRPGHQPATIGCVDILKKRLVVGGLWGG